MTVHLTLDTPTPSYPPVASPAVMETGKWRAQQKMEKAAGFTEDKSTLISEISCDACEIFIGRDHEEQELYFYPLLRQYARLRRGKRCYEHAVFHLCGDCASRRGLPLSMQFFGHTVWQTRRVIMAQEVTQVEAVLYAQLMKLYRQQPEQEMPGWDWWGQWIPPVALPHVVSPLREAQPAQQQPTTMIQAQIQGAIRDIDALLSAFSIVTVPTLVAS